MPVSTAAASMRVAPGDAGRLALATAGDDYELLFAAPPRAGVEQLATPKLPLSRIGRVVAGTGLRVIGEGGALLSPERLGYEH